MRELYTFMSTSVPWGECKVDEGDFGGDLRRIVWIGQLCGDVHLEVIMVGNNGVT